jgi:hypothetical protein
MIMAMAATDTYRILTEPRTVATSRRNPGAGQSAIEMLRRGSDNVDAPDKSYWTAYDHFMIEREARAMRAAHIHTVLVKFGGWLKNRVTPQ